MVRTPTLLDVLRLVPSNDLTRAAKALGLSPATLMKRIEKFESALGFRLVDTASKALKPGGNVLIVGPYDRTEFTLGRMAEGQPIVPDIDLSPYNAYANGVSRLHAAIKLVNNQVVIIDLGSSNGTYINGTRLSPYVEMPVADGDIAYIGKLKVQLLIST